MTETQNDQTMPRVLVVDDEPINVMVLQRLLKHCGVNSEIARNGAEAIEKALTVPCDVILMDISMPVMDGIAAAQEISSHLQSEGPAIVAVTANDTEEQRRRCEEAGFAGFMPKPVRLNELRVLIEGIEANISQS